MQGARPCEARCVRGVRMKQIATALVGAIALSAIAADTARSQAQTERTVEQYACKDVMRESGGNRDVAIAFLHGFLLGRSGSSKFDLDSLKKKTDAFIDHCLDHPAEKAVDAMSKLK